MTKKIDKKVESEGIDIGTHIAIKDGNKYIYKAKPIQPFKLKVKSSYKDKPQFPIIEDVEDEMKKDGHKMIFDTGVGVVKFLAKL